MTDMTEKTLASVDDVMEALYDVVDPELGINIVDLGLVYGAVVDEENKAVIDMTLTSAACPALVLHGLQWPDPGIELLLRQLRLQVTDAAIPERCFGRQGSPQLALGRRFCE